jgi:methionyl-tRNA formyltransferase
LELNKYNLVVQESDLPKGKGWSPLTWQVIEGFKKIPITLFEAKEEIDSGDIFLQDYIELEGTELINDIRRLQGEMTIKLCLEFIKQYDNITGRDQSGESTYYRKRLSQDSELDINRSIKDQFNLLRVVDNERYPAFFVLNEKKYIIKIYKSEEIEHKSKEEQR